MKKILFILFLAITPCAHAQFFTPFNQRQVIQEVAFDGLLFIDDRQTQKISSDPHFQEQNKYLGIRPGNGRINRYFIADAAVHAFVSYMLPDPWRDRWQWLYIGYEAGVVTCNYEIGIHTSF